MYLRLQAGGHKGKSVAGCVNTHDHSSDWSLVRWGDCFRNLSYHSSGLCTRVLGLCVYCLGSGPSGGSLNSYKTSRFTRDNSLSIYLRNQEYYVCVVGFILVCKLPFNYSNFHILSHYWGTQVSLCYGEVWGASSKGAYLCSYSFKGLSFVVTL